MFERRLCEEVCAVGECLKRCVRDARPSRYE